MRAVGGLSSRQMAAFAGDFERFTRAFTNWGFQWRACCWGLVFTANGRFCRRFRAVYSSFTKLWLVVQTHREGSHIALSHQVPICLRWQGHENGRLKAHSCSLLLMQHVRTYIRPLDPQAISAFGTPTVSVFKHAWASLMQGVDASLDGTAASSCVERPMWLLLCCLLFFPFERMGNRDESAKYLETIVRLRGVFSGRIWGFPWWVLCACIWGYTPANARATAPVASNILQMWKMFMAPAWRCGGSSPCWYNFPILLQRSLLLTAAGFCS